MAFWIIFRVSLGGDPGPRGGGPQLQKMGFRDIELQIFGAECVEIFEKLRFLRKNGLFGVLWEFAEFFSKVAQSPANPRTPNQNRQ